MYFFLYFKYNGLLNNHYGLNMYKRSLEKHINNYRLQYWLYAILNKEFGKTVRFYRDSLHSRYEVNRHGFDINPVGIDVLGVKKYLTKYLENAGFSEDKNSFSGDILLKKVTQRLTGKETLYINIGYNKSGNMKSISHTPVLSISLSAYWHLNKGY